MEPLQITSAAEQTFYYLRVGLIRKVWANTMPGGPELARQLGVGRMTIEAALSMLESEGLLVPQGPGRRRRIVLPKDHAPPTLRVAVLFYDKGDEAHALHTRFQNKLTAAGHTVVHAPKYMTDLDGNTRRLVRMVKDTEADAWVVLSGSGEVMQYFEQRQIPVFALHGWFARYRIAGIMLNLLPALVTATRRLIALGHQRIVMLERCTTLSNPGPDGVAFLDEMAAHDIQTGNYNMPGWEGGYDGLYRCLESLFSHTPPTAIFIYSAAEYIATLQFLAHRGLRVPQDVSLVCIDMAPYLRRYQPTISHVRWNDQLMVNRIARWAKNISHGKEDTRQTKIDAEFVEGGTVGPVNGEF